MKISELFLNVQIEVVTHLWCQIKPTITGLVLTSVLSALSQGYVVFRRTPIYDEQNHILFCTNKYLFVP